MLHPPQAATPRWRRRFRKLAAACLLWPGLAAAGSSVLIWPVDPHLDANDRSVALWLENHGDQPVSLQIRVLAWHQNGHADGYAEQDGIQASPPLATIAPGKRQMVRLIQLHQAPAGGELDYRVLVDEIPRADAPPDIGGKSGMGVRFQMRYSVPLFVYGPGVWVHNPIDKDGSGEGAKPGLSLRVENAADGRFLVVANRGPIHARLAQASLLAGGQSTPLAAGLLGYVLPGAELRVPLPAGAAAHGLSLKTKVNDEVQPWTLAVP